jgi:hypothetical protein
LGEPAALGGADEAGERAERDILFIPGGAAGQGRPQPVTGQPDQSMEVALPELLDCLSVAVLESGDLVRD